MGKIVKYCSNCEESFAEKFSFCPNCAQPMTAFEMNPLNGGSGGETVVGKQAGQTIIESKKPVEDENILEIPVEEPIVETAPEPIVAAPTVVQTTPRVESEKIGDTKIFTASNQTQTYNLADIEELGTIDELKAEEPSEEEIVAEPETKTFAATAAANGNGNYKTEDFQTNYKSVKQDDDDGFHITVIEEKNSKQRNGLLLGTMVLMVITALSATVYSIFNKDIGIGEIGGDDGVLVRNIYDEVPPVVDEPPPPPKEKTGEDGGGGGGGGRKDDAPISKGELPPQFKDKPLLTPSKEDISVTNPSLAVMRATRGKDDIIPTKRSATNGDPNSTNTTPSNGLSADNLGMGQNGSGGIGNNGRDGYGANGEGGRGLARGNDYGNRDGGTSGGTPPPPPKAPEPKPVGPTEAIKILSRPQPRYTDAARTNNVTGTVTLKVTFMANGQIGSVTPVSGLPYGLTEQAIAAAKSIRFEPAKRGGEPYSVSKTVTYNFTIY